MTNTLTDLAGLCARAQDTVHTALVCPTITGFSITDFFIGTHDTEGAAIHIFSEPMATATIIKATFAGALGALSVIYGHLPVPGIEPTDIHIPNSFHIRHGDLETVTDLFNDTVGQRLTLPEAMDAYSSYQPDILQNTAEVAASFVVALFATADTLINQVPFTQETNVA